MSNLALDYRPRSQHQGRIAVKALACCLLLLCSCHTAEAVAAAPVEFWITAETIGLALLEDLRQILGFFLPVL